MSAVTPVSSTSSARRTGQVYSAAFALCVRAITVAVVILLVAPLIVIVGASLTQGNFMAFPPSGMGFKWYETLLHSTDWLAAIRTSLIVASSSSVLATVVGATLALALSRFTVRLSPLLRGLALLPLLFPPVVIGVAFLSFYYHIGLVHYGYVKLILSHAIFNEPFPFLLVYTALGKVNPEIEQAAMSLGATVPTVFRTVTIPLVASEIVAGLVLAFVLSLNDFIIAFLVSSFTITTLPIQIFSSLRYSYSPLIAVASSLFIVVTILGVFAFSKVSRGMFD